MARYTDIVQLRALTRQDEIRARAEALKHGWKTLRFTHEERERRKLLYPVSDSSDRGASKAASRKAKEREWADRTAILEASDQAVEKAAKAAERSWADRTARLEKIEESGIIKAAKQKERKWATETNIAEAKALTRNVKEREFAVQTPILETKALTQTAIERAKETLKAYYNPKTDKYYVGTALLTRRPEIKKAVKALFKKEAIDRIEYKIKPGLTIGTGVDYKKKEKLSPGSLRVAQISKIALPMAAVGIAIPEPATTATGLGVVGAVGAMAVLSAFYGVYQARKAGVDIKELPAAARQEFQDYLEKMGGYLNVKDVVLVNNKGQATSVVDIDPKLRLGELMIPPSLLGLEPGEKLTPPQLEALKKQSTLTPPQLQRLQETIKAYKTEVIYLPTPATDITDITKAKAGLMKAETALRKALPRTETIPVNWDKILNEAREAKNKKEIEEAFSTLNLSPAEVTPAVRRHYDRVYADYLRKMAILEAARHQYVESLQPMPVRGKVTPAATDAIDKYMIEKEKKVSKKAAPLSITRTANKLAVDTYTKALEQGKTSPQALEATKTAVRNALNRAVKTNTLTRAQAQTLTQAAVSTAVSTATATGTAARPATRTATAVKPLVLTPATTATATGMKPFPLKLPTSKDTEEEKREYLEKVQGFVARRRGALGGKSVWRVNFYPYGTKDEFIILGPAPAGANLATGTGSVSRSATLLKGVPPKKPIYSDTGAVDDVITSRGNKIIITSVKDKGRRKLEA